LMFPVAKKYNFISIFTGVIFETLSNRIIVHLL